MKAAGITRRLELEADRAFRFQLFCESRPPAEDLRALDAALQEQLSRMQFAAQTKSYHASYPQARFEIIVADGVPIGRIVTAWRADACIIVDIAVLASWRSRGVGAAVVREICVEARNAGAVVRASVSLSNIAASRFWSRLEFETVEVSAIARTLEWRPPPGQVADFIEPS